MSSFVERRRAMIKEGEGCIPHMYLDTVGKVTVAVGQMLPTAAEAERLTFIRRDNGNQATDAEIRQDFEAVARQTAGRVAAAYKQFTQLDMPEDAINALLDARIEGFEAGLRRDFSDYDSYPDEAKLGLMDMAFNLGGTGLKKYAKMKAALEKAVKSKAKEDWETAAKESHRNGIQSSRNDAIYDWIAGGR